MTSLRAGIDVGRDEYHQPTVLHLDQRHHLVGGQTSFGKSVYLRQIIAAAVLDPDIERIDLIDVAKLGAEFHCWTAVGDRVHLAATRTEAIAMLEGVKAEMGARFDQLRARGMWDRPLDRVLVIDELAGLLAATASRDATKKIGGLLQDLATISRAAGLSIICATQKAHSDLISTNLRDLFSHRLAFKCSTSDMAETILGKGVSPLPVGPGFDRPGIGLLVQDDGTPRKVRTYNFDRADVERVIAHVRRPKLLALPRVVGA